MMEEMAKEILESTDKMQKAIITFKKKDKSHRKYSKENRI